MKKKDNDDRRHKSRCKYYNNNFCEYYYRKCFGSTYCETYKIDNKLQNNKKKNSKIIVSSSNKKLYGNFKIKFLSDNLVSTFEIGKNINSDAPLINEIINSYPNKIISINDEKFLLLEKNLYYK